MGNSTLSGPLTVAGGFIGNVTGVVVDNAKVTTTNTNATITLTQPVETVQASLATAQTVTIEPSVGKIITVVQTAAGTNNHTFTCNGGTWDGTNKNVVLNAANIGVSFVFITATKALVIGTAGANVAYNNT